MDLVYANRQFRGTVNQLVEVYSVAIVNMDKNNARMRTFIVNQGTTKVSVEGRGWKDELFNGFRPRAK